MKISNKMLGLMGLMLMLAGGLMVENILAVSAHAEYVSDCEEDPDCLVGSVNPQVVSPPAL